MTEHIPLRAHVLTKMDAPLCAKASLLEEEEDPSDSQSKGTTTHALVFNTDTVVPYPGAQRRGKEWDKFEEEHDGCRVVTKGEYEQAQRMCDAVRRHKLARELLEGQGVRFEQTILFKLEGRVCRGTPDIVGPGYIADLKTGRSANPKRFRYNARDYFYDVSQAWYRRAVPDAHESFIICVESKRPYPVSVFRINQRTLAQGDAYAMEAFKRFRECERTGKWPEYSDDIIELDIPERSAQWIGYSEAEPEAA